MSTDTVPAAACISDVIHKAGMCGRTKSIKHVTNEFIFSSFYYLMVKSGPVCLRPVELKFAGKKVFLLY